jgi:phosphate transport system substrate-binding protein
MRLFIIATLLFSTITFARATELNWVGCGISKKAYMTELSKAYTEYSNVKINLQGGGATRGIRDVAAGSADFGGSCRYYLLNNEKEKSVGLEPVAWDALVVIVNKNNPVKNINFEQIHDLYLGKITNWKELGGNDAPIELLTRKSKNSGVGHTIRKLIYSNLEQDFVSSKTYKSSGPLEKAVITNPLAIAITGVSSARLRDVKILSLNDKSPDYRTIKAGRYALYRPLYITYNANSPNIAAVKDFIKFVHSRTGRSIMKENRVVPYLEALPLVMKQVEQDLRAQKYSSQDITY